MDVCVGNKYTLSKKIGAGSFGDLFLGYDLAKNSEVAIKLESNKSRHPQLLYESKILKNLQNGEGIPKLHWYGEEGDFRIMVQDLLGPNLEDLFNFCERKFSLKNVLLLGDQILARIHFLHEQNFVHRDIKPENFLVGLGKQADKIFLVDFGLARKYKDPRSNMHIPCKENKSLAGTPRFASISSHLGIEQSRRDDLESLGYMLIYFLRGSLPWQGCGKTDKILEIKVATPISVLCEGFPEEFAIFLKYSKSLKFEEKPDYTWIQRLFKDLFKKLNYGWDYIFDWALLSLTREREEKTNLKNSILLSENKEPCSIAGHLKITVISAHDIPSMDMVGESDCFCKVSLNRVSKPNGDVLSFPTELISNFSFRTPTIGNCSNPVWNFTEKINFDFPEAEIKNLLLSFEILDEDIDGSAENIGKLDIGVEKIILQKKGKIFQKDIELFDEKGKKIEGAGVMVEIVFEEK